MCLYISEVPTDWRAGLVVPGYKILEWRSYPYDLKWVTPYWGASVPKTGLLVARRPSRRKQFLSCRWVGCTDLGGVVMGGFIHSWWVKPTSSTDKRRSFSCFAIGVTAYGSSLSGDMTSIAVYIPDLDRSSKELVKARSQLLENFDTSSHRAYQDVIRLFPELKYRLAYWRKNQV